MFREGSPQINLQAQETLDSPEKEPELDFVQIFHQTLDGIEPFTERKSQEYKSNIGLLSLTDQKIIRIAPVVIFSNPDTPSYQLELFTINKQHHQFGEYPHSEILFSLYGYLLKKLDLSLRNISGYIIQDQNNNLFLSTNYKVENNLDDSDYQDFFNLLERYSIFRYVLDSSYLNLEQYKSSYLPKTVFGPDIGGKIREKNFLQSFASRYQMTDHQFMRFRLIVNAHKEANQAIDYDQLAEEIVRENQKDELKN